jgi:hypothetical protein
LVIIWLHDAGKKIDERDPVWAKKILISDNEHCIVIRTCKSTLVGLMDGLPTPINPKAPQAPKIGI